MSESYITHLHEHSPAMAALVTLVLVLTVGTAAQILADRLRLPAAGAEIADDDAGGILREGDHCRIG